jgi:hypothetical protein
LQCIPTDTHVEQGSKLFQWVPEWATVKEAQTILEAIIPKIMWEDFNEVYGSLAQLFRKKEHHTKILQVLERHQNASVRAALTLWMKRIDTKKSAGTNAKGPPAKRAKKKTG